MNITINKFKIVNNVLLKIWSDLKGSQGKGYSEKNNQKKLGNFEIKVLYQTFSEVFDISI